MLARLRTLPRRTLVLLAVAFLLGVPIAVFGARSILVIAFAGRLRHAAAARGLVASWQSLRLDAPLTLRLGGLAVSRPGTRGDTVFAAESLAVSLDPWS